MKTPKISRWSGLGSLNIGLIAGAIGAMLFMIAYFSVNVAFMHFYGNASCTNSSRIGIFITAPVNYCENLGYKTFEEGTTANMAVPAVIMLVAIAYSMRYEKKFKKYLSFRGAILVAVASTYLLSALNMLFAGKPGAGTSIIGFDLLLFLFLGLLVDYGQFRKNPYAALEILKNRPITRYVLGLNRLLKKEITPRLAVCRAYNIIGFLYQFGIFTSAILLIMFYIPGNSFDAHLAGGFILLFYLFLTRRNSLFRN